MTEVEKTEVVDGPSALAIPDSRMMQKYLDDMGSAVEREPEAIADGIVARILAAETVEEVLAPQAVEHARDLVGVPILVHQIKLNESDFDTGPGFYAIVEAEVVADGRTTTFSCGGRNVLAQLYKLAQLNALPAEVVLREAVKETKNGGRPIWLEMVGPRDAISGRVAKAAVDQPA